MPKLADKKKAPPPKKPKCSNKFLGHIVSS